MLRIVLDANVYVSALIRPEGPPGQILARFLRGGDFDLVVSPSIIDETLTAFRYPKVRKYLRAAVDPALWFEDLVLLAHLVEAGPPYPSVSEDPDDDKYFAAALAGQATLVVSGDPDLLSVGSHEGIRVVSPRALLDLLSAG